MGRIEPDLRLRWLGLAAALVLLAPAVAIGEGLRDRFDVVVIDAGHGGSDFGATGQRGLVEKNLVLDVALRLAMRLRAAGLAVTLTRTDDTFVPLEVRTSVANDARGDLFISVHANSAHSPRPSGFETYFVSLESSDEDARQVAARENEVFGEAGRVGSVGDPLMALLGDMIVTEHVSESSAFAKLVQSELARIEGEGSRGVKQAPFVVLMGVQMPASLIEIGFLSNPEEERALDTPKHRDAIVDAMARAVISYAKRYAAKHGVTQDLSGLGQDR